MFFAAIYMHVISKGQRLCWKSWSAVAVQTGEQNKSVKTSGFPELFLYGSQLGDRTQELFQEQYEGKHKVEAHMKNKERGR